MEKNNAKKKILYVITKSNWGGAQRYVYDLAMKLPDKFESVVAFGGSGILNEKLSSASVRTIAIPKLGRDISVFGDIAVFFSLIRIFLKEKPYVVHLNSSKIGGLGALAGRVYNLLPKGNPLKSKSYKIKTKIIFTVHGWAFNEPRGFFQKTTIKFISWITVFLSHKTIAVSQNDHKQGKNMLFVDKKVHLVHSGIDNISLRKQTEAREIILGKKASKLPENTLWIGTIAELTKNKGLEYAIEAIGKFNYKKNKKDGGFLGAVAKPPHRTANALSGVPPLVFTVIGDGEDKFKLSNIIKNAGLSKKVFLVGFRENASSLLNAFDIFLLPSLKEGLPYVVLEAGNANIPIIASHVGGIPEIIDDMKSGILVRSKDSEEIYKAIVFLIEHRNKMAEFKASLHSKINKEFSIDKMIKETLNIYKR
jgi:glycosyltransferase involved in cell wall biosynthesis